MSAKYHCCENPTCTRQGEEYMKLADDCCDTCGHPCRNCPPSEGDINEEFLLSQMVKSAEAQDDGTH